MNGEMLSSIHNAFKILREFSQDDPELGVIELSRRTGLSKSSVSRIVQTLCKEHVLQKNIDTRKYRLWLTAFELGSVVYHELEVCRVGLPVLKKMMESTPGVIQLVVYDRGSIVFLLKLPEDDEAQIFNSMGVRVPCHCTASGKILLAFQDELEINRVLKEKMKSYTKKTITTGEQLSIELQKIKQTGYALSREEFKIGVSSVAVPVYDDLNRVIAAINVTRPTQLLSSAEIDNVLKEMKYCSRLITERVGIKLSNSQRRQILAAKVTNRWRI
ncbi:hypothetical protein SD71_13195 [Cohnella kolymensis]|uniref:IclR family transcriptional regulator n=1 Tax=Cohnella kolymensis TaxID=1590652 RepID=A0ABR5A338_9BACL|nr:IclR family transcriptional regulator [Cohnella kolymensis]KIL35474.1 hypothetical protein SD71_13195 [Cohnella kolymensis]